ncbi:MAG: tetratricopeptide repeat protein, partial [Myxococcales bacterium]|nr:tetratricopeptide repeat protein [Myxococcales bacterium]
LLLGVLGVLLLRPMLPDPWVLMRTFGRVRSLRSQIEANPANVTARRDLARLYLERGRPRAASQLLELALRRDPQNAELLYLLGAARHRSGRDEEAIEPLVHAVEIDPRVSFGEAFLVAGDALSALGRHEAAVDAYERYVDANSSSIRGWTKLAHAHRRHGEPVAAQKALREARRTWRQIPAYRRRQELLWFLGANLSRLWI